MDLKGKCYNGRIKDEGILNSSIKQIEVIIATGRISVRKRLKGNLYTNVTSTQHMVMAIYMLSI